MNGVSVLSFSLILIFSVLAISMVDSRTLSGLPETTELVTAEASSRTGVVDGDDLVIADQSNDDVKASAQINDAEPISSSKPVKTIIDNIPITMNVDDSKIVLGNIRITITVRDAESSQKNDNPTTVETEPRMTKPDGPDADLKDNIGSVPHGIGASVFFGKMATSSEMQNRTSDDFYDQVYPTLKSDKFLLGKFARVADTPHNRMMFAKFAEKKTNAGDDITEVFTKEATTTAA